MLRTSARGEPPGPPHPPPILKHFRDPQKVLRTPGAPGTLSYPERGIRRSFRPTLVPQKSVFIFVGLIFGTCLHNFPKNGEPKCQHANLAG